MENKKNMMVEGGGERKEDKNMFNFNQDLNLKTFITISGIKYPFQILSVESGVLKRFILGDNEYGIVEQKQVKTEKKPIASEQIRSYTWTSSEDQILIDNYKKYSVRKIIEKKLLPRHSANAIYYRLNCLKLRKYEPKKIKNANINFNQKILSNKYHNIVYEQCFNFLVFKLESKESFTNKDLRCLIKEWYKNSLNTEIKEITLHNYEFSYKNYGLDQGFIEKIENGLFRIPKIVKNNEEKPVDVKEGHVKGFSKHVEMRIQEIKDNKKLFEKQNKREN